MNPPLLEHDLQHLRKLLEAENVNSDATRYIQDMLIRYGLVCQPFASNCVPAVSTQREDDCQATTEEKHGAVGFGSPDESCSPTPTESEEARAAHPLSPSWEAVEVAEGLANPAIGKIKIPEWRAMVTEIAIALDAHSATLTRERDSLREALSSILKEACYVGDAKEPFTTWVAEKARAALATPATTEDKHDG